MKEIKLLDRVQAVIPFNNNLILATIQDHILESGCASNAQFHNSLKIGIHVLKAWKSLIPLL